MAATASGSLSSGAWPTPGMTASFIPGATACILAAVSAVNRSLFSPRTTSNGFWPSAVNSGHRSTWGTGPAVLKGSAEILARARAYAAVDKIRWPEGFCRRDIGWRALARESDRD